MKNTLKWYLIICCPTALIFLVMGGGPLTQSLRGHIADHALPSQEFYHNAKGYEGLSKIVIKDNSSYIKFQFPRVLKGDTNRSLSILLKKDLSNTKRSKASFAIIEEESPIAREYDSLLFSLIKSENNAEEIFRQHSKNVKRYNKCPNILVLVKEKLGPPRHRSRFAYDEFHLWMKKGRNHCDNNGSIIYEKLGWPDRSNRTKWLSFYNVERTSKINTIARNHVLNKAKAVGYTLALPLDFLLSPVYMGLTVVLFITGNATIL